MRGQVLKELKPEYKMKLVLALLIGALFLGSPLMAEDKEEKKTEKPEGKKKKKAKKAIPAELIEKKKEIMAKVKAGDMTKEEGKEAFKKAMMEYRKANPKKKAKKDDAAE